MARGPDWVAEIEVDAAYASRLIARQFPPLAGLPVEPFAAGWDNTVMRVRAADGDWAFRFPRREIALAGVRRELVLLPALAPGLPLAVPVPELLGEPSDGYPWPFFGARLLPGCDLAVAAVPDSARTPAAAAVGMFLRALHTPDNAARHRSAVLMDPMNRGYPPARSTVTRERLERIAKSCSWKLDARITDLLIPGDRLDRRTERLVLVHGDLHVRHLLVDEKRDAVGIIDWGDSCIADPSVDLSIAYSCFVGESRAALLHAYGGIDADRELRSRALAVSISAALAEHAAAIHDEPLLTEAMAGLDRAVS